MKSSSQPHLQLDLFTHISAAYAESATELDNESLYEIVRQRAGLEMQELNAREPIGFSAALRSPIKRKVRWYQQTLKQLGVIERVDGKRGVWKLTESAGKDLDKAAAGVKLVAFNTELGVAVWGRAQDVFRGIDEPVHLCLSSPPYPLRNARAYGNPDEHQYVDFICNILEPIARNLVPGGSIVLNVSEDIFKNKSPARSLYIERMVLALHDRLGLSLMGRIPWVNYSKPPGPTYWACVNRVQLSSAYEPVFWFTNDPLRVRSDNRRVLEPHSLKHLRLMHAGGEQRTTSYGDGAYRIRPGSHGNVTKGKIPRNVLQRSHNCADTRAYRAHAKELGLPIHGAMQPSSISDFFVRFLTEPGDLVVDPCGGTIRTGLAAERLGRRWIASEWILQYLRGAGELFRQFSGFEMHPAIQSLSLR